MIGPFIQSLQEDVAFRRTDSVFETRQDQQNRQTGTPNQKDVISGAPWTNFTDATKVKAVVLPRVYRAHAGVIIEDDNQYTANLTPPHDEIRVGDELVRSPDAIGQPEDQTLTIVNIQILRHVQQLRLENRDQPIQ